MSFYAREPHIHLLDWLAYPAHAHFSWKSVHYTTRYGFPDRHDIVYWTTGWLRNKKHAYTGTLLTGKDWKGPHASCKEKKGGIGPESDSLPPPSPTTYLTFASIPAHYTVV